MWFGIFITITPERPKAMNQAKDETAATSEDAEWSFDEIAKSERAFARAEKKRFHEQISACNPSLAAAFEGEAARFTDLSRDVITPIMHEVAETATGRGYHVFIRHDDLLDRPALLGTPAVRFYCSPHAFQTPVIDLVWSPSFIVFFGCIRTKTVTSHVELTDADTDAPRSYDEASLEYSECTAETIRSRLMAFMNDLPHPGAKAVGC